MADLKAAVREAQFVTSAWVKLTLWITSYRRSGFWFFMS